MGWDRFNYFGADVLDFVFSFFNAEAKIGVLLKMKFY